MLKKFLASCVLGLLMSMGAEAANADVPNLLTPTVAEAEQYWCHNDGTYDYYIDTRCTYAGSLGYLPVPVIRSDGTAYEYRFRDDSDGWKYTYFFGWKGPNRSYGFKGYAPVSSDQLANDILYVALQIY